MDHEIRNCEDALRVLAEHVDDELDAATRAGLQHHLDTCRSCYSRAEFERRLRERVGEMGREPVPHALSARVDALIREFTAAS